MPLAVRCIGSETTGRARTLVDVAEPDPSIGVCRIRACGKPELGAAAPSPRLRVLCSSDSLRLRSSDWPSVGAIGSRVHTKHRRPAGSLIVALSPERSLAALPRGTEDRQEQRVWLDPHSSGRRVSFASVRWVRRRPARMTAAYTRSPLGSEKRGAKRRDVRTAIAAAHSEARRSGHAAPFVGSPSGLSPRGPDRRRRSPARRSPLPWLRLSARHSRDRASSSPYLARGRKDAAALSGDAVGKLAPTCREVVG